MAFEELRKKYTPAIDQDNTIAFAGYGQAVTWASSCAAAATISPAPTS